MSFHSTRFLQNVNDQPLQYNGGAGWQQIGAGLQLVAGGYCVLLLGSAVSGRSSGWPSPAPRRATAPTAATPSRIWRR